MTATEALHYHLNCAEEFAKAGNKAESDYRLMLAGLCVPSHSPEAHRIGQWALIASHDRCAVILRSRAASSWGRIARNGFGGLGLALLVIFLWLLTQLP